MLNLKEVGKDSNNGPNEATQAPAFTTRFPIPATDHLEYVEAGGHSTSNFTDRQEYSLRDIRIG